MGLPDVDQMLSELTAGQVMEWWAFYELSPWGEDRADLRAGIITAMIANCNRSRNTPAFIPSDFMPFAEKAEKKPQDTSDQIKALIVQASIQSKYALKQRQGKLCHSAI